MLVVELLKLFLRTKLLLLRKNFKGKRGYSYWFKICSIVWYVVYDRVRRGNKLIGSILEFKVSYYLEFKHIQKKASYLSNVG